MRVLPAADMTLAHGISTPVDRDVRVQDVFEKRTGGFHALSVSWRPAPSGDEYVEGGPSVGSAFRSGS